MENLHQSHRKMRQKISLIERFFDAVAFILGYEKPIYFEGEYAMWLEKVSQEKFLTETSESTEKFCFIDYFENDFSEILPRKKLFDIILEEKLSGKNAGEIELNFHYSLIKFRKNC